MGAPLILRRTRMLHVPALALVEEAGTRARLLQAVVLRVPSDFFKADGGAGFHDGQGEHWITVHPNGPGTRGTPVKIRESTTQKGVFHVIAGAGGKLNYLKLTGVKSPEEHKAQAKERDAVRRTKAAEDAAKEEVRRARLSDTERAAEDAEVAAKKAEHAKATKVLEDRRQHFVSLVSESLGWTPEAEATDGGEKRGDTAARSSRRRYQRAREVLAASRQQLLRDRARARGALGDLPLVSDDPETLGLTDVLDPPAAPRGKGFRNDTQATSDQALRRAAAAADVGALRVELAAAEHAVTTADDPSAPELHGRVADARAQLHMAELLREAETITPEHLATRRGLVREDLARLDTTEADVVRQLDAQRDAYRAASVADPEMPVPDALTALEQQAHVLAQQRAYLHQQTIDLAVLAGEGAGPAIEGEQAAMRAREQADRETEIAAQQGSEGVARYRLALERAAAGRARQAVRRRAAKGTDVDLPVQPVLDPEKVLTLLAHEKAIRAMERDLAAADGGEDLDARIFGKGYFTETGDVTPAMRAEAERALVGDVHERATRAFLEAAEDPALLVGHGGQFTEDYDQPTLHRALERHLSAGAYNALNNAALAAVKTPVLRREVVDVLGAGGAAQLLAHTLRQHEDPKSLRAMAAGLADYHLSEHVEQAEGRIAEMTTALDAADAALQHLTNPTDIGVAVAANEQRQAQLETARRTIGQALGEYEATAALAHALTEKAPTEIHCTLGPIDSETAIRQIRALGLAREDYAITSDGTNHFATVRASGFDKLVTPPDAEHLQLTNDVLAIKRGEQDEAGWQPKGTTVRTATTLNAAQGLEPESLTARLRPLSDVGSTGDVRGDVEEHIARRAASGDDLNDIAADLASQVMSVPERHRQAFGEAVNAILPARVPTMEKGKPVMIDVLDRDGKPKRGPDGAPLQTQAYHAVKASAHADAVNALVEKHFARVGAPSHAPLNTQSIDLDHPDTHEAVFRALANDPRAMVAFAPPGTLTSQHQRTLRQFFASEVATQAPQGGRAAAEALRARLAELGPEPPRTETGGLFGGETTSAAWLDWSHRKNALVEQHHFAGAEPTTPDWPAYVTMLGGTANAYAALQDQLKGRFVREFHRHYTTLTGQPLRIGTQDIAHAELHTGYLDPAARARHMAEHRSRIDAARNRTAGRRYAVGSVAEKLERMANMEEAERQAQGSLLGATSAAAAKAVGKGQRHTLGVRLEEQLRHLMPNVAQHFRPGAPVQLMADKRFDGRFIHQQRVIKHFLRTKRLANATGTGSGKTSMMIGALAHARATPATGVKRGLFLVPSAVQGQFGGEFARFVDPKTMRWAANPGGDQGQRLGEHRDADTHAVVHTHQAFRDDMVHVLADHLGVDDAAATKHLMGLPRAEAATLMRDAWKKAGIDYQMISVDEGHGLLDRDGKPDSVLSRIVQATTDVAPYYMSSSADPVKNDVSELRSLLDKLHPDGRYADAAAWKKRYGVNTTAAAEALKREVAPWVYAAHIPSGIQVNRRTARVPLHPEQAQRYAGVMDAVDRLRAARGRGGVDVEAAKVLAPERFGDGADHEAVAREIGRNPGAAKEAALARIIDGAPRATNAKIQHLVATLKDHPVGDKPVVIFAHRRDAVREITEALAEAGHRVESLTGADSAAERDRKRQRFQPETGKPEADVFVLSDAGQAGLNLQRGQTLIQYDRPMTAMGHAQRNGRIDRLGQHHPEIDLIDLTTDTPYEARAARRVAEKYELRNILTDPAASIDDEGLAGVFSTARRRAAQGAERDVA